MYHKKMNVPGEQFNERCNLKPLELDLKICSLSVFLKWAIPGLFFFIFVFSIHLTVNVQYKFLPMYGFEPRISGMGSDRSTN